MSLLHYITAEPRTKKQIAELAGWYTPRHEPDTRAVEREVNRLRLEQGVPIVSDSEGYRLAQSSQDVWECYRWLRSKHLSQARTAWMVRRMALRMEAKEAVPLAFEWSDAA